MSKVNNDKLDIFESMPVPKAVASLAVPTIIGTLVTIVYNLADTYFVGYINDPNQTAAITIAGNITLLYIAVENLFGIGGASIFGRAKGSGNTELERQSASFSLWAAVFTGILFSIVYTILSEPVLRLVGADSTNLTIAQNYLFYVCTIGAVPSIFSIVIAYFVRTEGYSVHASAGTLIGCILNIILDPFFILPQFLDMKAAGAGLATLIGNTVACVYMIAFIIIKRKDINVNMLLRFAKPNITVVKEVALVGIPSAIQNILNVIGQGVLNSSAASFGVEAISAIGIAYKLYFMPMNIATAISQGAQPIWSYCYGNGNKKRFMETLKFTSLLSVGLMVLGAVAEIIFAPELIRCFMDVELVVQYGSVFLIELCIGLPFFAFDFVGVGVFQASGKGMMSLYFAIARKLILEIPLICLFVKTIGVYGLGISATVTETVLAIVTIFVIRKLFNKFPEKDMKVMN